MNGREVLPHVPNRKPNPDAEHRVPTGSGSCGKRNFIRAPRAQQDDLKATDSYAASMIFPWLPFLLSPRTISFLQLWNLPLIPVHRNTLPFHTHGA